MRGIISIVTALDPGFGMLHARASRRHRHKDKTPFAWNIRHAKRLSWNALMASCSTKIASQNIIQNWKQAVFDTWIPAFLLLGLYICLLCNHSTSHLSSSFLTRSISHIVCRPDFGCSSEKSSFLSRRRAKCRGSTRPSCRLGEFVGKEK